MHKRSAKRSGRPIRNKSLGAGKKRSYGFFALIVKWLLCIGGIEKKGRGNASVVCVCAYHGRADGHHYKEGTRIAEKNASYLGGG